MNRTPTSGKQNSNASTLQEYTDGRSFDPQAVRQITQQWIDMHMKNRESEFTKTTECSVFCGTWNVNAKKQEGGLHEWLLPTHQPDIYAVGFQEIVDLNALNVALNSNNTQQRAVFWQERIKESLDSTNQRYDMVAEKYLVGLYLVIYVKESLANRVRDVRSTSLGVGIMGMMGNKGGVSIRLSVYDSTLCFVCAHLAAHRENVAGRNSDYKNIYEKSLFPTENGSNNTNSNSNMSNMNEERITDNIVMPRQGAARYFDATVAIPDHDIVFWMGDLNYRIDDTLSTEQVFQKIKVGDLETLRTYDQLNIERNKKRVFHAFQEGILTFLPTYKYQPGTDSYETRAEKKLRAPAWCDRVLWKCAASSTLSSPVKLLEYNRANLIPSDHKPVYASFNVVVKQVIEHKENNVFTELLGGLGKFTSKAAPTVTIEGLKIKFDKIGYEESKESIVTIRNTGEGIVHWHLVNKLEDQRACKRWLSFSTTAGLLLPNQICEVKVTAKVDSVTAQILNMGKDLLQDLVVLRIERSVDHFIEVSADYERSCFGLSLEALCLLSAPVATLPLPAQDPAYYFNLMDQGGTGAGVAGEVPEGGRLSLPKEIWRLVDALVTGQALREKDLFNSSADTQEVITVRKCLDNGTDFPPNLTPHAYVDCLLSLLSALPRPVLPPELYPTSEIEDKALSYWCRKFLEDLPPLHYNVFVYLLSFFREVLLEEPYNRCTSTLLSSVCIQSMTVGLPTGGQWETEGQSQTIDIMGPGDDHLKVYLNKEERQKRLDRQGYLQKAMMHLLTTNTL